uniref:Long-chain-fatty-acid--CoA ligase n=1 Tax=Rhabditophanes sp. KR3021 TaxID=114890 RepID=A0AC35TZJ8_9BILA
MTTTTRDFISAVLPSGVVDQILGFKGWPTPGWPFTVLQGTLVSTSLAAFIYFVKRMSERKLLPPKGVSRDHQSIEVKGEPGVYKSALVSEKEGKWIETFSPEVTTVYEAFQHGLKKNGPNQQCLGWRESKSAAYKWHSYSDIDIMAKNIGSALVSKLGVNPANTSHVGIYSVNCPEWFITALGCAQHSIVVVPLYDTLGAEAASFIVQQTEINVILVDNLDKVDKLLSSKSSLPTLNHIIVIQEYEISKELESKASELGVHIHTFADLEKAGECIDTPLHLPNKEDNYIICYTSGTTGQPKGVELSHKNIISNVAAFIRIIEKFIPQFITEHHTIISFLPMSHMYEMVNHTVCISMGFRIGYFRGKIAELTHDLKALKPTIFPVVPRLLSRFYDLIQKNVHSAGPIAKQIFHLAYSRKLAQLKRYSVKKNTIWDKLVFKKIQDQMGGNVKFMITGSAPISAEVLEMCRVALGAIILEGYGQTECNAMSTLSMVGDYVGGHVGAPVPCNVIKLVDVPELNYYAKDNTGEILIKGPNVTKGYYKNPEKTAELFTKDGYLQTGDIGRMLPNGTLQVIDRKKNIFKLAQGEYIQLEKLICVYQRCDSVQQVFVDGNSLESYLVAIVVPDPEVIKPWFKENVDAKVSDFETICKHPKTLEHIQSELDDAAKESKFNSIEKIKALHLDHVPFSVENDLLTPTLKAKTPQLRKHYADVMVQLYKTTNAKLAAGNNFLDKLGIWGTSGVKSGPPLISALARSETQLFNLTKQAEVDMFPYTEESHFSPIFLHSVLPEVTSTLQSTYAEVDSAVEPCPDLTQAPFNLSIRSLGRQIYYLKSEKLNASSDFSSLAPSSRVLHQLKNGLILTDGEATHCLRLKLRNGQNWKAGIRTALRKTHSEGNWGLLALQILSNGNTKFSIINCNAPTTEVTISNIETSIWLVPLKKIITDAKLTTISSGNVEGSAEDGSIAKKKIVKRVVKKKVKDTSPEVISEIKEDVTSVAYVVRMGSSPAKDGVSIGTDKDSSVSSNESPDKDVPTRKNNLSNSTKTSGFSSFDEKDPASKESSDDNGPSIVPTEPSPKKSDYTSVMNTNALMAEIYTKRSPSPSNNMVIEKSQKIQYIEQKAVSPVRRSSPPKSMSPPVNQSNDKSMSPPAKEKSSSPENTMSTVSSAILSEMSPAPSPHLTLDDLKSKLDSLSTSLSKEPTPPRNFANRSDKEETPTSPTSLLFSSAKSSLDGDYTHRLNDMSLNTKRNIAMSPMDYDRAFTASSSSLMSGFGSVTGSLLPSRFLNKDLSTSSSSTTITARSINGRCGSSSNLGARSSFDTHLSNAFKKMESPKLGTVSETLSSPNTLVRGMPQISVVGLQLILKTFSYKQIGNLRQVHPHWDELCGQLLNSGYYELINKADKLLSECQRRVHNEDYLSNPIRILTNLQMYVLNCVDVLRAPMDEGILCFPYGEILDKSFIVLEKVMQMVKKQIDPETPISVVRLTELARKAQNHFKEVVEDEVERRMGESQRLTTQQRLQRIDSFLIETTVEKLQKQTVQSRDEMSWEMEQLKSQNVSLKKDNREMKAQLMRFEGRVEALERKFKTVARLLQ